MINSTQSKDLLDLGRSSGYISRKCALDLRRSFSWAFRIIQTTHGSKIRVFRVSTFRYVSYFWTQPNFWRIAGYHQFLDLSRWMYTSAFGYPETSPTHHLSSPFITHLKLAVELWSIWPDLVHFRTRFSLLAIFVFGNILHRGEYIASDGLLGMASLHRIS